jgi:hypothetical protein
MLRRTRGKGAQPLARGQVVSCEIRDWDLTEGAYIRGPAQ